MTRGIYEIRNVINNKVYIGMSKDTGKRWSKHRRHLEQNRHQNKHLQASWNKHPGAFQFRILETCTPEQLSERECYWISVCDSRNTKCGYNSREGGSGGRHSPEVLARIGAKIKGNTHTEEVRAQIAQCSREMWERHVAEGRRRKSIRPPQTPLGDKTVWNQGVPMREESRIKLSESLKGQRAWNRGREWEHQVCNITTGVTYATIKDVTLDGYSVQSVLRCLRGERQTYKRSRWQLGERSDSKE